MKKSSFGLRELAPALVGRQLAGGVGSGIPHQPGLGY